MDNDYMNELTEKLESISNKIEGQKDIYKLWYEFLKRSELYKDACEWIENVNSKPNTNSLIQESEDTSDINFLGLKINFDDWLDQVKDIPETIDKFNDTNYRKCIFNILKDYYVFWGNVFVEDFESFWVKAKSALFQIEGTDAITPAFTDPPAFLIDQEIQKEAMLRVKKKFTEEHDKEPSLDEFIDYYSAWDSGWQINLSVLITSTLADITKSIKQIVKDERKERKAPIQNQFFTFCRPSGSVDKEACERYLIVYDLKVHEGLTWENLIRKEFYTDYKIENDVSESFLRACKMDLQKAKKIISNVEAGFFPGKIN